jgi:hypothetical protein
VSFWKATGKIHEEFGFYYGAQKYDTQREFYHPTYMFGLSWSPARER